MIDVEPVLVAYLVNRPDVTALIGNRLYPNVAPQKDEETGLGTFPHATYYRASTARTRCLQGTVGSNPTVQFDCWAEDYPAAKAVALAIAGALNDYSGNVQGQLLRVQGAFVDEDADDYEPPQDASERGVHRVSLTVRVYYSGV